MRAARFLTEKRTIHILALLAGLLPALFFLVFLVGEAVGELLEGKVAVIPLLALLLILDTGYLLSWFRARTGSLIMIIGSLVLGVYLLILSGFSSLLVFLCFSLPFLIIGSIMQILLRLNRV